jgi:hypothetical protein
MLILKNINEINRQNWIKETLSTLPNGTRTLDTGADELKSVNTAAIASSCNDHRRFDD